MTDQKGSESRMAVLCKKLGNMWSEIDATNKEQLISKERIDECKLMLFGKLYTNPNVNYQAFINTMKKAWKVEDVHGLPVEWCSEAMVEHVTQLLGSVQEVKIVTNGGIFNRIGKAKVIIPMDSPLSSGTMANLGEEKVWLDFKYERLPRFCYACGKLCHFTTACSVFPYEELKPEEGKTRKFGGWLKSEVREKSPFWNFFHGDDESKLNMWGEEEMVPETQPQNMPLITWESPQLSDHVNKAQDVPQTFEVPSSKTPSAAAKGKQHFQYADDVHQQNEGMLLEEHSSFMLGDAKEKKYAKLNREMKSPKVKKTKRYNPYGSEKLSATELDETNL